jgi:toxin ParE1/3/4
VKVVVETAARAEFDAAQDYYREHASLYIAASFVLRFERAVELLRSHPDIGTPVSQRLRSLPLRRFPYTLIYEHHGDSLRILAVAHQRRRPRYWARRR